MTSKKRSFKTILILVQGFPGKGQMDFVLSHVELGQLFLFGGKHNALKTYRMFGHAMHLAIKVSVEVSPDDLMGWEKADPSAVVIGKCLELGSVITNPTASQDSSASD